MREILKVAPSLLALALAALPYSVQAQAAQAQAAPPPSRSQPMAVPVVDSIPDAVDVAWPGGTMTLDVDATDTKRGLYRVVQTIPLGPNVTKLTLLHPQWLPGHHGPRGTTSGIVDLRFTAGGKPLEWKRDPVDVNAFHITVPAGSREVVARFIHTSPLQPSEGRISMTQEMMNLQWERVSLYPAGHYVRRLKVKPTATFLQGWTAYAALDGMTKSGNRVTWAETDFETLVDSPVLAGINARSWDLGGGISFDAVADKPENLALPTERLPALKAMGEEALELYGARHYDRYHFLVSLTDKLGDIGLEHHRSSENGLDPESLVEWDKFNWDRNVLTHELSHSWVGKFRRPATIWTPDYRQPMRDNLLWVYEGQNQFWGWVLAARSGLQSRETVLGMIAGQAANLSDLPGRAWRPLEDTTHDPIITARAPLPYTSMSRSEDYYQEGALIWLEADQIIRAGTAGRKGLDDFARAFFGIRDGDWGEVTFEFDDIVTGLNSVYPYDWATFLRTRIELPGRPAPIAGIEMSGYRLVWKEEPNSFDKGRMEQSRVNLLTYSLGMAVDKDGVVANPRWDGPAFNAGLVSGSKILAVNGIVYEPDVLKKAITAAKGGNKPIELLVRRGDRIFTVPVMWNGGLRYPWLERIGGGQAQAGLDRLLAPRRRSASSK